ncbi:MAG: signal recognition particle-docking protein FtsY [Gammaproteobacteria bacterium]|nr:signal recognition particle-docking protein FtsY [Gammaproteobacteria bacterium]MDH5628719.1 signal recognition particle-docking protein FtsY [Gammaproteobacteria bacterium]
MSEQSDSENKEKKFSWFGLRKSSKPEEISVEKQEPQTEEQKEAEKLSFFQKLRAGLAKTRDQFSQGLADLVLGEKSIDEDTLEELETILLMADVGVETTSTIIDQLTDAVDRKTLKNTKEMVDQLKQSLLQYATSVEVPLSLETENKPFVILVVGVNGAGKTTTIGKMAHQFLAQGKSVMLAAGDTFRAAAVEQLKTWGDRNNVAVVAQHTGADSASVIFDAVESAKAKQIDVVIADTAGRLHNKSNLMEELTKVKRVMGKIDPEAPHEVMLVVDGGTGQNALVQAIEFNKSVKLTGITVTKLDGTAKGGIIFALADRMKLPIRYIGVGESKTDLRTFNAAEFVEALFETDSLESQ